jgi:hypothetical protein
MSSYKTECCKELKQKLAGGVENSGRFYRKVRQMSEELLALYCWV